MTMAPLMSPAPFQDPPFIWNEGDKQFQWHPNWEKWISNLSTVVNSFLVSGRSTLPATLYSSIALLQIQPYSTSQINSIVNPENGLITYDKTIHAYKRRKPGVWEIF